MSKLIRKGSTVIVILGNGQSLKNKNVSNSMFKEIKQAVDSNDTDKLLQLMVPKITEAIDRKCEVEELYSEVTNSEILTRRGNSVYWDSVSPLSLPEDLVTKILEAEKANNKLLVDTYKNFWTLLSLNPDEECRKNLFWFLQYHGMVLSRSGFFIAYRNVDITNKSTADGRPIYTDHHSHTTRIVIGEPVRIDIKDCDRDSNHECSLGLHCASVKWLEQGYYGGVGLAVLVNPAKVVAVPFRSGYGKLRTCEYLPIDYISYDESKHVIPYNVEDGFDCQYVSHVIYEGLLGSEDAKYTIDIPEIPGIDKDKVTNNLLEIARKCIQNKYLKNIM